jgi:hypothetical protein
MADRGTTLMLYISDEEKARLGKISEATERDMSKMVRYLINREYERIFPGVSGPIQGAEAAETVPPTPLAEAGPLQGAEAA